MDPSDHEQAAVAFIFGFLFAMIVVGLAVIGMRSTGVL